MHGVHIFMRKKPIYLLSARRSIHHVYLTALRPKQYISIFLKSCCMHAVCIRSCMHQSSFKESRHPSLCPNSMSIKVKPFK